MKLLCEDADSFIYVVSRMGITGASSSLSTGIEELLARVHKYSGNAPAALGFGVSTREHFLTVEKLTEGVVIGSKLIDTIGLAPAGKAGQAIQDFCTSITHRTVKQDAEVSTRDTTSGPAAPMNAQTNNLGNENDDRSRLVPGRFGEFGGRYVSEALMGCLIETEEGFSKVRNDPKFWEEFRSYYSYIGRPSCLHYADHLSEYCGGGKIYLKREDLNHTGSHKVNNALGQILLARRLGKTKIIAETGAGQHGVATATMCAKFGMKCVIYMGAEDVQRQALNVFRIKLLGASVVPVEAGSRTLRDAVNEALRAWVADIHDTHYLIGSAIGPHPMPTVVRSFQSIIGEETKEQMQALTGRLPDAVVACVGGGSNATGMFYPFSEYRSVKLLGVEAAGDGLDTGRHSATLNSGTKGVLHGVHTYLLQDKEGQCLETHSISAGLDYPGVGPELSFWKDKSRAEFTAVTDAQALEGLKLLSELEGILPALESAHAVYAAIQLAKTMSKDQSIVINLSGRGDKDVQSVADALPRYGPTIGWDLRI